MLAAIACLLAAAAATPVSYDQRQDGDMNVRADVQNIIFLVALPRKLPFSMNFLETPFKNAKHDSGNEPVLQERADVHAMESFVEPSTPYHVEISGAGLSTPAPEPLSDNGEGKEVVIAGRRSSNRVEADYDGGLKLLGATEQCGPGRARDAEGICRDVPEPGPEEPSSSADTSQSVEDKPDSSDTVEDQSKESHENTAA